MTGASKRAAREAAVAAARERELLAAAELWAEWPGWSRLKVAQVLAKRPGARSRRAIYMDLPERADVLARRRLR